MRSLALALLAAVAGGLAGAQLAPAAAQRLDCPPPVVRISYAECEALAPDLTWTADQRNDWMRECVDGAPAATGKN